MSKIWTFILGFMVLFLNTFKSNAQDVSFEWVKTFNAGLGSSITTDNIGNIYVTGNFTNVTDFNPGGSTPTILTTVWNKATAYVAKYNPKGNLLWAKCVESKGFMSNSGGNSIIVDNLGNIVVTGGFNDTIDFNPNGPSELIVGDISHRTFIWKLDSSGNHIWVKRLGGGGQGANVFSSTSVVDIEGNIYTIGAFNTPADFDPGPLAFILTPQSINDAGAIWLCKLTPSGNFVWARQSPVRLTNYALQEGTMLKLPICLDQNANIYFGGPFRGTEDFDPGPDTFMLNAGGGGSATNPNRASYVAKWDSSGNFIWAKHFQNKKISSSDVNILHSLTIDNSDGIFVSGQGKVNGVDFDPGPDTSYLPHPGPPISSSYARTPFVVKLDTSGNFKWVQYPFDSVLGSSSPFFITVGMDVDASGNLYSAGYFNGFFKIGTDTLIAEGIGFRTDAFITKIGGSSGNKIWAKQFVSPVISRVNDLSIDNNGNVYTIGDFWDDTDFDPDTDTALAIFSGISQQDFFVHKMACIDSTGNAVIYDTAVCLYPYGDTVYRESGTYYYPQHLLQQSGCRSDLTLVLTIKPLEVTITIDTFLLSTTQSYSSYQWLFNGVPIPGANSSTYRVTENGNYSVIVTDENGCQGTSEDYAINNVSVSSLNPSGNQLVVYPNPNVGRLFILSGTALHNATIKLVNIIGQSVMKVEELNGSSFSLNIAGYPAGVYFIEIEEGKEIFRAKLIKE